MQLVKVKNWECSWWGKNWDVDIWYGACVSHYTAFPNLLRSYGCDCRFSSCSIWLLFGINCCSWDVVISWEDCMMLICYMFSTWKQVHFCSVCLRGFYPYERERYIIYVCLVILLIFYLFKKSNSLLLWPFTLTLLSTMLSGKKFFPFHPCGYILHPPTHLNWFAIFILLIPFII